jgi:hypothetical protein
MRYNGLQVKGRNEGFPLKIQSGSFTAPKILVDILYGTFSMFGGDEKYLHFIQYTESEGTTCETLM